MHIDHNLIAPSQHLYTAAMCTSTAISPHQANICTLLYSAHRPQSHHTKPTSVHCCNVHIDHNLITPSQHLYTAVMCTLTTISPHQANIYQLPLQAITVATASVCEQLVEYNYHKHNHIIKHKVNTLHTHTTHLVGFSCTFAWCDQFM